MKKIPSLSAAVVLLLLLSWKGKADQPSVLTDIRYGVLPDCSRVTLVFGGDIRFSPDHGKGLVRLGFSRTRLAPSAQAAPLRFSEGLVRNVVVTRFQGDSLSIAVTLREHTTYRCVQPSGGNEVHIDVFPAAGMAGEAGQRPASVVQGPSAARVSAQGTAAQGVRAPSVTRASAQGVAAPGVHRATITHPTVLNETAEAGARERVAGLIDIAAIARAQVETEARPANTPHQKGDGQAAVPADAGSPLLLIGLMAMVALASGGFVFLVMRRAVPVPACAASPATAPAQQYSQMRGSAAPADENLVPAEGPDDLPEEEDGERETSLQLARSFRRGSEEIALSRRLHAQPAAPLSVGKMQQMLTRSTTQTQRLHAARKLGVGRGEVDLALKLKTLRPASPKNEEDV